ncbi:uncharacterized protein HMPREF1541_06627 [Cyphellophora europaea CBS 101466]|uniref:Uncharacterized protein n=1 Tax=Cyphellophora europaea (strain CBS 101466) TaxID=1220924 RepID=W2RQJ5_CYPE1|nr:uncharacterized protein HMPREF1541_06627 [Cyphellophora europaea CBS 101466]ETN38590.1 hypothetical protein HMPREF1541_06627 [Cyphellophora europaea CBS 101466]
MCPVILLSYHSLSHLMSPKETPLAIQHVPD